MKLSRRILPLLAVIAIYVPCTVGQDPWPIPETENRPGQVDKLPEFVVEVRRPEGCLVGPVSSKTKSGIVLYALPREARFLRAQGVASKVLVYADQRPEGWHVRVTIGTGEFYDAGDTKVGDYMIGLNQRIAVPDFARFGLAPIQVGVAKIIRGPATRPDFSNKANSLETTNLPDPYKLRLRNNSNNDLIAIQYNTFSRGQFLELKWLSDGLTKPLAKPGETYELKVSSEDNSCGDENGYSPGQSNRIELVTAVFADGTFEGDSGLAALIKGAALGNRMNLEKVVQTLEFVGNDPDALANELNNLQVGMNEEVQPYLVGVLRSLLPPLQGDSEPVLNSFIRAGMHDIKVNLARDAQYFQIMSRRNNGKVEKDWVERTKGKYERWLVAAQRMTSQ
jgi:hypothetical protein